VAFGFFNYLQLVSPLFLSLSTYLGKILISRIGASVKLYPKLTNVSTAAGVV